METTDSLLTYDEIAEFIEKIFNQDYKIEMKLLDNCELYTLTNKNITIKTTRHFVYEIIIKGRKIHNELLQAIIKEMSEEASRKLSWIIEKWYRNNEIEKEKQRRKQIIEDNKFIREYINESEE